MEAIANLWNFQRFNMIEKLEAGQVTASLPDLIQRLSWGGSVLLGCLILSSWIFQRKDLT
jgi:hypothetical protein